MSKSPSDSRPGTALSQGMHGFRVGLAKRMPGLVALLLLVFGLALMFADPAPVVLLRENLFDAYQKWHPRRADTDPVRIVDIDNESLARLGQWPWPRTTLAHMVDRLSALGAAAIVFDIVFAEPDRTSSKLVSGEGLDTGTDKLSGGLLTHDQVLAASVAKVPVVTGFILTDQVTATRPPKLASGFATAGDDPLQFLGRFDGAVLTLPEIEQAAAGNGALNFLPGRDGIVRRVPMMVRLGDSLFPTLALEALRVANRDSAFFIKSSGASGETRFGAATGINHVRVGDKILPTDAGGALWIHYARNRDAIYVPAWKLIEDQVSAEEIEGRIVLIGTSAAGLMDLRFSALGTVIPGVEVHAQAIEQMIDGSYLLRPDWAKAAEVLLLLATALGLILLIVRVGPLLSSLAFVGAVTAALAVSAYAFAAWRLLLDPLTPALTLLAIFVVTSVLRHLQTEREKQWIRGAFATYISPNLVRHLVEHPDQLRLSGERRECSFVMTDLAGFTSLVERSSPESIVALLNEYLEGMIAVAFQHEGTVEKIVGDAVSVMFSAPLPQPDHAARAVACAADMDAFSVAFRARMAAKGITVGVTRIGVNSGPVIVGNFGGSAQLDYRALGDAINTAARLETANKRFGTRVLISGTTADAAKTTAYRPVGHLLLKGKTKTVEAFELLSPDEADAPETRAYRAAYEMMASGDPSAVDRFVALAEDYPSDPLIAFHRDRLLCGERGPVIDLTGGETIVRAST